MLQYSKKTFKFIACFFLFKTDKLSNALDIDHRRLVVRIRLVDNSSAVLVVDNNMPVVVVVVGMLQRGMPLWVAGKDSGNLDRPAVVENCNKKTK